MRLVDLWASIDAEEMVRKVRPCRSPCKCGIIVAGKIASVLFSANSELSFTSMKTYCVLDVFID